MSGAERQLIREQSAGWLLAGALGKRSQFWDHAELVASAPNAPAAAHALSLRYCQGKRRRVIATLLLRAAATPSLRTRSTGHHRLELIGSRACFVPDEAGRSSHYAVGGAFIVPLLRASYLVAAMGAGECVGWLRDGSPCVERAAQGSVYCRRHDKDPVRRAWESERDTIVRRLFALATPAVIKSSCRADWSVESSTDDA